MPNLLECIVIAATVIISLIVNVGIPAYIIYYITGLIRFTIKNPQAGIRRITKFVLGAATIIMLHVFVGNIYTLAAGAIGLCIGSTVQKKQFLY